jgi:hypothetical protein
MCVPCLQAFFYRRLFYPVFSACSRSFSLYWSSKGDGYNPWLRATCEHRSSAARISRQKARENLALRPAKAEMAERSLEIQHRQGHHGRRCRRETPLRLQHTPALILVCSTLTASAPSPQLTCVCSLHLDTGSTLPRVRFATFISARVVSAEPLRGGSSPRQE